MLEVINTWFWCTLLASFLFSENYFRTQVDWVVDKVEGGIDFAKESIEHRRQLRQLKEQKELETLNLDERLQTLESIVVEEEETRRR